MTSSPRADFSILLAMGEALNGHSAVSSRLPTV